MISACREPAKAENDMVSPHHFLVYPLISPFNFKIMIDAFFP